MENAAELFVPTAPSLTDRECELLNRAREIADTLLEPNAEKVDESNEFPWANIEALGAAGLAGVTTPEKWGGAGATGTFQREFTEILAAACGTTYFIFTQHLGSCGQIANSGNAVLQELLPDMAAGQHYVGVGFGHLRRPEPMLIAEPIEGGWLLTGTAPYVTGWPMLSAIIFGATLPDGRHIYLYAPALLGDTLHVSEPLPLCAMNASATVEVYVNDLYVPEEHFIRYSSREEMAKGDTNGIAAAVGPPLGCAVGSLKNLRQTAQKRAHLTYIAEVADKLEAEIIACRTECRRWAEGPKDIPEYKPNALKARAWAIELSVRAAQMAVTAASGGANSLHHPAQRRFREAMFYGLIQQTGDIMAVTLARLARSPEDYA